MESKDIETIDELFRWRLSANECQALKVNPISELSVEKKNKKANKTNPILSGRDVDKDERNSYRDYLLSQLDMAILYERYPYDRETLDSILDMMLDVICSNRKTIRIAGDDKPVNVVKSQFLKLNSMHVEYVMSALAHDIKTPLTIVRGNAELLSETELTTEQKNNITYVLNGTTQIQSYVKQLIDVTKSWNCSDVTYTTVRLEDFFADIKEQALGLVEIYHQKIDWKAGQSDKKVTIAYDPMFRAVMNMIQNAVEHTKENGIIYIDAKEQDGRLTFIVEDSGSGFTKEALLHGTEQFFMDDTSRNGEAHYGMGLFFAKTVAEKYGGGIKLSNSENTGGARVEIFFLSSQETS